MRIIGGTLRGRSLKTLRGARLRPTADRLRQSLFDILARSLDGARFLDLYAGSGAVGLEALSRGAGKTIFIEVHRPATKIIQENLQTLGLASAGQLLCCPAVRGLDRLAREGRRFDFVFLDPPYNQTAEYKQTLPTLDRLQLIAISGWVVAEHSRRVVLEQEYGYLKQCRQVHHGNSQLTFFQAFRSPNSKKT